MELNQDEKYILSLFKQEFNKDTFKKYYKEGKVNFSQKNDINNKYYKTPFNICIDLSTRLLKDDKSFNKYIYCIINNALMYSDYAHDSKFIIDVLSDKEIYYAIKLNPFLRAKLMDYAIRYLILREFKLIDLKNYTKSFEKCFKLLNSFRDERVEVISNVYRKIVIDLLSKYPNDSELNILDSLLTSDVFNDDLKSINETLFNNSNNYILFKKDVIRIILSDAFIYSCSIMYENGVDDLISVYYKEQIENEDEVEEEYDENDVYEYIKDLNGKISLPNDDELREEIYSLFVEFNTLWDKSYDLSNFEDNKDNVKVLKKINPLYTLEAIERYKN